MRHLATALAFVVLCACAGQTNGDTPLNPPDGGGGVTDGGGDAGTDGGTDAGADAGPDAGCVPLSLNSVSVVDLCGSPQNVQASVSVSAPPSCAVNMTLTSSTASCSGVASHGTLNAFDGTCSGLAGYSCTSTSLPGTLHCTYISNNCTIQICSGSTCP